MKYYTFILGLMAGFAIGWAGHVYDIHSNTHVHKFLTLKQCEGVATCIDDKGKTIEREVILKYQACKCGEERGLVIYLDGWEKVVDVGFLPEKLRGGKVTLREPYQK